MLTQPTTDKLRALRMRAMAEAYAAQQSDPECAQLSFDERLGLLVDAEMLHRDDQRLARLLKEAKLRLPAACPEGVRFETRKGLDRATFKELSTLRFVHHGLNVLLTGPTGVGKTYLACALGNAACRNGIKTTYRRLPRLCEEIALARGLGTWTKMLEHLRKIPLLILDDWGLSALGSQARHDLLEILDDRFGQTATLVTSQLPIDHWHDWLEQPTLADAILDRLLSKAYKIDLQGPSFRKEIPTQ